MLVAKQTDAPLQAVSYKSALAQESSPSLMMVNAFGDQIHRAKGKEKITFDLKMAREVILAFPTSNRVGNNNYFHDSCCYATEL